jgi:hypothetical protein
VADPLDDDNGRPSGEELSWRVYRKLILALLRQNKTDMRDLQLKVDASVRELFERIDQRDRSRAEAFDTRIREVDKRLTALETELREVKVRAGLIGGATGVLTAIATMLGWRS